MRQGKLPSKVLGGKIPKYHGRYEPSAGDHGQKSPSPSEPIRQNKQLAGMGMGGGK